MGERPSLTSAETSGHQAVLPEAVLSPPPDHSARAAVVHEWLLTRGGSEKVTLHLLRTLPHADLYAAIFDPREFRELEDRRVRTTFLDRVPGARRHYRHLLPLMSLAYEQLDLAGYDLVISSSHSCAKNVLTGPGTYHLCYCHTPMRHAWEPAKLRGEHTGRLPRAVLPPVMSRLREQDLAGAARVDRFLANSRHVAARIRKYYRRKAEVVHPPVDVEALLTRERRGGGPYLVVSRLVPYKRVDLAVDACTRLGRELVVVGEGRERERLEAMAGPSVSFVGAVDDAELGERLAACRGLLFPGEEDFGIVPVEAQAAGAPVIAYGLGGVLDSVVDGVTGLFFSEQTTGSLADAILRFEGLSLDPEDARRQAARFRPERFYRELRAAIELGPEDVPAAGR
ncbi:MAG: glycosyltransferase [Actinomycetota bacterium]|nr:glycosyltransferase [Actinomycetota bacterium]